VAIREAKYVWMDGGLVDWKDAKVHVLTHALQYGTAVFEGIRAYWRDGATYIFRLDDHLTRLFNSAKTYFMEIPYSRQELREAIVQLLQANAVREDCYIRPLVYRGYGVIGLNPLGSQVHAAVAAFPFGKYLDSAKGVSCCVSSWRRIPIDAFPPDAKAAGNYVNSALAKMEALKNGYDEAIFLDSHGYVCEGTGENIFIVRNGVIYTPAISAAILEGITRDSVMGLARDLGKPVVERMITRNELYVCDEAFFSGTAAEITPIISIDKRPVGGGQPGPVARELQALFFRVARGEDTRYSSWVTKVVL